MTASTLSYEEREKMHALSIFASQTDFHSTRHNQNASPLLRLPAELRNKIYYYVSESTYIRILRSNGESFIVNEILPLLNTFQQIHVKTSHIPTTILLRNHLRLSWFIEHIGQGPKNTVHTSIIPPSVCAGWHDW